MPLLGFPPSSLAKKKTGGVCFCKVGERTVGGELFSVTSTSKSDVDYLGESTKGDLNVKKEHLEMWDLDGHGTLEGPIEEIAQIEAKKAQTLLCELGIVVKFQHTFLEHLIDLNVKNNLLRAPFMAIHSPRGIFCTRTLNLRSISAIGYDMDYTLIQYNVMVIRGLVMDKEKGNLVKADRFGYVKRAMHGTKMLSTRAVSEMYGRELVDLRKESRWEFLNTFFSVSEAVMFMQLLLNLRLVTSFFPFYSGSWLTDWTKEKYLQSLDHLITAVAKALFRAHVEGQLKNEIMAEPDRFVVPDPELPLALLDQKEVIVSARKPEFFQMSHPMYEVVTGEGLMRPCFKGRSGGLYSGGSAQMVENSLNVHGDEILYVGDHIYTDVSQSKVHLRWRTALICRELEEEFDALIRSQAHRAALIELVQQKETVGDLFNQLRLALQRRTKGRPAQTLAATNMDDPELTESMRKLLIVMERLDRKIAPMLEADGEHFNKRWGYLSRAGLWDKSHLTRQIEKYADIYTSRVSNFLHYTPFMYFRSQEQVTDYEAIINNGIPLLYRRSCDSMQ
ncbi:hypothetical protein ACLOJK_022074 [Asimina triloba]